MNNNILFSKNKTKTNEIETNGNNQNKQKYIKPLTKTRKKEPLLSRLRKN